MNEKLFAVLYYHEEDKIRKTKLKEIGGEQIPDEYRKAVALAAYMDEGRVRINLVDAAQLYELDELIPFEVVEYSEGEDPSDEIKAPKNSIGIIIEYQNGSVGIVQLPANPELKYLPETERIAIKNPTYEKLKRWAIRYKPSKRKIFHDILSFFGLYDNGIMSKFKLYCSENNECTVPFKKGEDRLYFIVPYQQSLQPMPQPS